MAVTTATRWTNWVGNQSFQPAEIAEAPDEAAAIALIRSAVAQGRGVRVPGTGHSFTPIVETDGILLNLDRLRGMIEVDRAARRVTAWSQTQIAAFGDPLWEHGLALANQGDIDTQAIAGAVATATHGSGPAFGSFSGALRGARIVTGTGDVLDVSAESDPDLLPALQTAIGMLGIMTRVTLQVAPAYALHERIEIMHMDEVLERYDELLAGYRHFSFFWMPADESAALYALPESPRDTCFVKLYREAAAGTPPTILGPNERIDRSYRIYTQVYLPNFHEMEYFLPIEHGREALAAQRALMRKWLPDSVYPLEVRFTGPDEAWLSPNYRRSNIVLSVSGRPGTEYWPYLRACDDLFRAFHGRPHWGKLHCMTADRVAALFPEYERFRAVRRRLDPRGMFLNPHLRALFE